VGPRNHILDGGPREGAILRANLQVLNLYKLTILGLCLKVLKIRSQDSVSLYIKNYYNQ